MKRSIGHNAAAAFLVALMAPIQAHAAEVDETSLSRPMTRAAAKSAHRRRWTISVRACWPLPTAA